MTALTVTAAIVATHAAAMEFTSDCDSGRLTDASRLVDQAETAWLGQVSSVRKGRATGGRAIMVTVNGSFRVRPTVALKGQAPKPVTGRWFLSWTDDGDIIGYQPHKDEVYLVLIRPNERFLERAACLSGLAEVAPSAP